MILDCSPVKPISLGSRIQEEPNILRFTPKGQPTQIFNRGMGYVSARTEEVTRLPFGHPEGLYEAFANMYQSFAGALLKRINGEEPTESDMDFPTVEDGVAGVKFIQASLISNKNGSVWTDL